MSNCYYVYIYNEFDKRGYKLLKEKMNIKMHLQN